MPINTEEMWHHLRTSENGESIMISEKPEDEKYVDRVIWLKDGLVDNGSSKHLLPINAAEGESELVITR